MRSKFMLLLASATLALSAGAAVGDSATYDTAKIPQPHLDAARAIAAQEAGWKHPGLSTCYPDSDEAGPNASQIPTPPPTKVFDNLYFVGDNNLTVWAIDTSDGIILIDAMNNQADVDKYIIPGMKKLGLDPARIKILIIDHSHGDHFGGAKYVQDAFHVPHTYMSAIDWDEVAKQAGRTTARGGSVPKRDLDATDGGKITLGGETLTTYVTPGHTPGALSILIPVMDHGKPKTVMYFGGAGNRNQSPKLHAAFDVSAARLIKLVQSDKVDGYISNHAKYFDAVARLFFMNQHPDAPNPFLVGNADTVRFVQEIKECNLNYMTIQPAMGPTWRFKAAAD